MFPSKDITKGPSTLWDAPGMQRIKIPLGKLSADQLDVLADVAEEYSDRILHVTTRQDIQLHFIHIEDTPDMHAAPGRRRHHDARGVRQHRPQRHRLPVSPASAATEAFDVAPYAHALTFFLLGHDDTQDFGRKFKVAFSGCKENACGLTNFHDIGAIARTREVDGKTVARLRAVRRRRPGRRAAGGAAVRRVPARRGAAADLAGDVPRVRAARRAGQPRAARASSSWSRSWASRSSSGWCWKSAPSCGPIRAGRRSWPTCTSTDEKPLRPAGPLPAGPHPEGFADWRATNVVPQRQPGYVMATITLPLGDLTSDQARALADMARKYTGDTMRTTVDQNMLLRWVSEADLPDALRGAQGHRPGGAGRRHDQRHHAPARAPTPASSASRRRARWRRELRQAAARVRDRSRSERQATCTSRPAAASTRAAQHHVADIGFLGVSRNVGGRRVPHFQLVVGGQWENNGGSYGLAIGAVPSKRVPEVVKRLTERFVEGARRATRSFADFATRIGKKTIRAMVEELQVLPTYDQDPSFYSDWGDPREYTIADMGEGECAGEVVPYVEVELAAAERELFEAQVLLDEGKADGASTRAFSAMLAAARALTREKNANVGTDPNEVVAEFRKHFYDTQLFFDPFAGGKFAQYLFRAHEERSKDQSKDAVHQLIEEATLFVDAAHQCYTRLGSALRNPTQTPVA